MVKQCEWCKKEFEAKRSAKTCSGTCRTYAARARNLEHRKEWEQDYYRKNKGKMLSANAAWRDANPGYYADRYDSLDNRWGFVGMAEYYKSRHARLYHSDSEYRANAIMAAKGQQARKKQSAARAAYLADPINAARIAEANLSRMTPEEREAWHQKIEAEQGKRDRKERREALRREHAASQITPSLVITKTGDTFAHIEWAP